MSESLVTENRAGNILSRLTSAAVAISNLPEYPGYNGSLLIIGDTDAEAIYQTIDAAFDVVERERMQRDALLAALKDLRSAIDSSAHYDSIRGGVMGEAIDQADSAIAAAEGEQ